MNATKRTQKYGVGGGGWKIEGNGNPRPGTVMEEVLYVQHNKNGPRSIRLLAKSEVGIPSRAIFCAPPRGETSI